MHASNVSFDAAALMAESIELQHTIALLTSRVNRVVELVSQIPASMTFQMRGHALSHAKSDHPAADPFLGGTTLTRDSSTRSLQNPDETINQYLLRKNPELLRLAKSTRSLNIRNHSLGIRWDESDHFDTSGDVAVKVPSVGSLHSTSNDTEKSRPKTHSSNSLVSQLAKSFKHLSRGSSNSGASNEVPEPIKSNQLTQESTAQHRIEIFKMKLDTIEGSGSMTFHDRRYSNGSGMLPSQLKKLLKNNSRDSISFHRFKQPSSILSETSFIRVMDRPASRSASKESVEKGSVNGPAIPTVVFTLPTDLVPTDSFIEAEERPVRTKWDMIRYAVFESPDFIVSLKQRNEADAHQRKKSIRRLADPSQVKVHEVPFEVSSSWAHRFLLYRAFDHKGMHIQYDLRCSDERGAFTFLQNGLHPLSSFSAIASTFHIGVIFLAGFVELGKTSFYKDNLYMAWTNWIITFLFLTESIINALTPRRVKTRNRFKLGAWLVHYLCFNSIPDLISVVPWICFTNEPASHFPLSLLRLIRIYRLPHLLGKNPFYLRLSRQIQSIGGIGPILSRMIPLFILFFAFLHLQACGLHYVATLTNFDGWDDQFDHWRFHAGGVLGSSVIDRYVWMLTQAIGNTFSVSFKPESNAEQIVNLCFILVGAVLYALLVGLLSSAAISYDASGRLYQQKIDELMQYLTWKRIDEETKTRVLSYFEFKYRGKYFEEQSLLEDMNNSLRMELASINCRRLIEKVPFLHRQAGDGRDEIYLGKIATALKAAYYITGDYVFHQGDSATEMYFIQSGKVNIIVNSKLVSHANEGSFFGEVALIANIPRTASIQAAVPCVLYSLSANSFGEILNEFEDIKERVELIFQDRMEKVKKEKEGKVKALGIAKFL